ncbi:MAG: amino acid adenylation domain-containing protein [candidate division KSB1 bacterium]|nr:amino acid adenylation domain-containing protein [candidate division KSB1 bacterium]
MAYVVPDPDNPPSNAELRSYLLEKLPDYMVPGIFVRMEALPINPNGKLDRKALPVPDQSRPEMEKAYVAPRTKFEEALAKMWQEILGIERVGIYDNFFELGGNSLQAAVFVNKLQKLINETVHVRSIFLAPTIAEFSTYANEYYSHLLAKYFGDEAVETTALKIVEAEIDKAKKIRADQIEQFRKIIKPLPPRPDGLAPKEKNPPAIFVLSPPRSGSTLFRVMLAGHPQLFAPPELDLLSFNTLRERKAAFEKELTIWLEAAWRAIMEIKSCDLAEAQRIMAECEERNLSTKEFYALLQEWIGDKILVDKTPSYPLDIEILKRAEADFEDVKYIHLVRHPYATIYSFLEAKLDKNFFRYESPFTRRELAELIWLVCHQNILEFLKDIPAERQYRLKFEDLVSDPETYVRQICQFLQVDFNEDMLKPYQGKRMTDGVTEKSQMVGDFKFYLHKKIDDNAAHRWKKVHSEDFLSEFSWSLAEQLGYEREPATSGEELQPKARRESLTAIKPVPRTGELPLSYQQQRLWFLDQMAPGSSNYNIPVAVRISGKLNIEATIQSLNEIIRRHEVLRTNFLTIEGKPVPVISPRLTINMPIKDLSNLSEQEREAVAQQEAIREALQPFDLAKDALIRGRILKMSSESYVMLLTMHHIVSDGWSAGVIIQEFAALYQAFAQGKPAPLPELPIQYIDYAAWQREWLKGDVLQLQLDYWRKQLEGCPPVLELPTDRPRPAEITYNGASARLTIPADLTEEIKAFCRKEGVTEFMALLAAFQTLLYRYSSQTDICVGTPIANRGRAEIENLIGFFVNTLVLRTKFSGRPTFREVLNQVQKTSLGAYAHQELPFEMLVDVIQPERSMSHTPLFQVMFAFQNTPVQDLKLPGLIISPFQTKSVTSKFDITLSVREFEGEYRGLWEYNTDLFNEDTIKRMVRHFKTLLKNAVQQPELSVDRLPLLELDERQQLIVDWNRTEKDYPTDRCIHQLFEERAKSSPEALAVVCGDKQLTYGELNARANQLAHLLRKKGVGPDTLVGLCVERSVEMIVGILGIMKAGGAYAALDPSYPAERIQYILEDSKISILLTFSHLRMLELEGKVEQICLDSDWEVIARESKKNPKNLTQPENLAYLIYTSGSTGRPKGVMMPHRGAINLWSGLNQAIYANHPTDRPLKVSLNAPLLFDASVQQLVQLLSGHAIDIVPQEARQDGEALLAYLQQSRVDVLDCVPSQLKLLLEAGLLNGNGWIPSIFLPGGEAIDEATWKILQRAERTEFYNMYGPTECAVDSTIARIKTSDGRPVIGRPINNAAVYVLDANLEAVPIGVPGELYIAGEGLARGYLHRPDLTAERFLPDPFSIIPGERMYRTGDLVRYLPDGNLEFLGRIDHQVKVRGFRIELGEIEFALEQHLEVKQAVVIVREDEPGVRRLVGYIVPNAMPGPNSSDLKNFLKTKLPEYMIPAAIVTLEAMPLTPNAKIDRKALPKPEITRSELEGAFVAPRNEIEEKLAAIWKQLLGIDQVGVNDNFFELGGDSILTIQVIAKAKQVGLQLTPKQMFQYPTIAGLASVAGTAKTILAEQGLVTGEIPLTPIQHAFFEQNLPEPHHWNQSLLLEIRQEMNLDWLKEAIRHLLNHHDALRLRFERTEDGWRQINGGELAEMPFEYFDFSTVEASELENETANSNVISIRQQAERNLFISESPELSKIDTDRFLPSVGMTPHSSEAELLLKSKIEAKANEIQASLDLTSGRIVKFAYFDLGKGRTGRLLIVIHHTAIDGVSWRILLEDLYTAYLQLSQGQNVQLPAKTTSFQQWSQRLTEYAQSEALEKELAYWDELSQVSLSLLPVDFPGGSNLEKDAGQVEVALNKEETQALLKDVPAAFGTTINDVLLTAVASAFAHWTGENSLLVDLEGHGREDLFDDVDLSRTVGWFTSLYPVRLQSPKGRTLVDRLRAIKEQLHRIPNHGIGYGLLRYLNQKAEVRKRLQSQPHPEVAFNYLGQFDHLADEATPFAPAPESSGNERSLISPRSHKIIINGSVTGECLKVTWNYSRALHRAETIEQLAEGFVEALRNIITLSRSQEGIGYTPSDFSDVKLEQEELEELVAELEEA